MRCVCARIFRSRIRSTRIEDGDMCVGIAGTCEEGKGR